MENSIQSDKVTIIIPARYASTRLEGKPLLKVQGKPIIQWVYESAILSKSATDVIVATDDKRIFGCVEAFGGKAAMTREDHKSGSDRLVEVMEQYPDITIAVNVQGDEPLITPESIDMAINVLVADEKADISTLIRKIEEDEIPNPNVVKVVKDKKDYAMYFSRSPIPYERVANQAVCFAHVGLYVYRRASLIKMASMEQSMLEKAESLEQLRALENGMKIKTATVDYKPLGIDTKEDFEEFKKLFE